MSDKQTDDFPRCSTCDHWRHIRDRDYVSENQDETVRWTGPHGECMVIDEFSEERSAWLDVHLSRKKEDGTWADGEQCHADASLITNAKHGCVLHSSLQSDSD